MCVIEMGGFDRFLQTLHGDFSRVFGPKKNRAESSDGDFFVDVRATSTGSDRKQVLDGTSDSIQSNKNPRALHTFHRH
jgi:hypothetical protein